MKNKFLKLFIAITLVVFLITGCSFAFSFRNMTLDMVQLSDTHITSRADTAYKALGSSKALLKDAVEQINQIKGLDFVLFTGDMVDSATEQNFEDYYSIVSKLKYPSLNAFGNHDFNYGDLTRDEVLDIVKSNNPNYTFSDSYYAFSPKTDYRIIILDGVMSGDNTVNGQLSEEQLQFLDDELNQNQDKVVVIALHFPVVEPFKANEHCLLNADKLTEILLKYKNPIVVLSGHYHATKISHWGNLSFVSTPSLVTYPMAFRHIKIVNYKDRVEFKFDFIETRLSDVQELNRQSVISYSTLAGGANDRNLTYTFYKKHPKSPSYKKAKIKSSTKEAKTTSKDLDKYLKQKEKSKQKTKEKNLKTKKTKEKKVEKPKKERVKKEKQVKVENIKQNKIKKEKVKKTKVEKPKKIKEKKAKKEGTSKEKFKSIFKKKAKTKS